MTGTAWAEETAPAPDELKAIEIVDPYAVDDGPRIVEVVDPYVSAPARTEFDLERDCRDYCLAHRGDLRQPRRLPPPQQTLEWGGGEEHARSAGSISELQALGVVVLGLTALGGSALAMAIAGEGNGTDLHGGHLLGALAIGTGLTLGVVLVVDGGESGDRSELRLASGAGPR
jgi:hypothetical protein